MRIFRPIVLQWWQASIFKITMISIGLFFGTLLHEYLSSWLGVFLTLYIAGSVYLAYVWVKGGR